MTPSMLGMKCCIFCVAHSWLALAASVESRLGAQQLSLAQLMTSVADASFVQSSTASDLHNYVVQTIAAAKQNSARKKGRSSAAGSDLLNFGNNILLKVQTKYGSGNATAHLEDNDTDLLQSVIELINETMYGSMQLDHDSNQIEINTALAAIENCTGAMQTSFTEDVAPLKTTALADNSTHRSCRVNESNKHAAVGEARAAVEHWIDNTTEPPAIKTWETNAQDRTVKFFTAYFKDCAYCDWFTAGQSSFTTVKDAYDDAVDALAGQTASCNDSQVSFETSYELWQEKVNTTCKEYEEYCYDDANVSYNVKKAQVVSRVDSRKDIYLAGETIIDKIQCLLATGSCDTPVINPDRWDMNYGQVPDKEICDMSGVTHWVCSPAFEVAWYSNLPMGTTAATPVGCLS